MKLRKRVVEYYEWWDIRKLMQELGHNMGEFEDFYYKHHCPAYNSPEGFADWVIDRPDCPPSVKATGEAIIKEVGLETPFFWSH